MTRRLEAAGGGWIRGRLDGDGWATMETAGGGWKWLETEGGGCRRLETAGGGWRRVETGGNGWGADDDGDDDCREIGPRYRRLHKNHVEHGFDAFAIHVGPIWADNLLRWKDTSTS